MTAKELIQNINAKTESSLKEIVALKSRLKKTEEELQICVTKFDALSDLKLLADREIGKLKENLGYRENEIKELSETLLEKATEISRLTELNCKLEESEEGLKQMLNDKTNKCHKLEKELTKEKKALKEKSQLTDELENKLQKISLANQQLHDEIEALNELNPKKKNK